MAQCVITGCALVDTFGERWMWGDLHEEGDCYVFNGTNVWKTHPLPGDHIKQVAIEGSTFEKRGVAVFEKSVAVLNDAARAYLNPGEVGHD